MHSIVQIYVVARSLQWQLPISNGTMLMKLMPAGCLNHFGIDSGLTRVNKNKYSAYFFRQRSFIYPFESEERAALPDNYTQECSCPSRT